MLETIERIQAYTSGMTFEQFCADQRTIDAVNGRAGHEEHPRP
jgi:uncharacterized protein with HEPN domain